MSKFVNFSPIALLSFIISYHPHLFTLSLSQPPTSHLPSPSPGWSKPLISLSAFTSGQWKENCVFSVLTYVKWFVVRFISRIGLLDKLARVSSPILLALLIDNKDICNMCFCCCYAVDLRILPIKYLKLKLRYKFWGQPSISLMPWCLAWPCLHYLIDLIELLTFSLAAIFTDLHCQINHPMIVLFLK